MDPGSGNPVISGIADTVANEAEFGFVRKSLPIKGLERIQAHT
jgi:hypothetical protein